MRGEGEDTCPDSSLPSSVGSSATLYALDCQEGYSSLYHVDFAHIHPRHLSPKTSAASAGVRLRASLGPDD